MACSFGEIEDSNGGFKEIPPPVNTGAQPPVTGEPTTGAPTTGTGSTPSGTNTTTDPTAPGFDVDDPFASVEGQQVLGILQNSCASCHANGVKSGDMDYILDLQALIDNEKIIPGEKEDSPLYTKMLQQSMPPAFIREEGKRPDTGQIDLVGRFIDELPPLESQQCEPEDFLSNDEMIAAMAEDIRGLDIEDREFTRYLTITYSSNAGDCGRDLDRQRYALIKGINSVSTDTEVHTPEAIDTAKTIYRIDIRDYDWNRPIDIEDNNIDDAANIDFADAWLAIVDGVGAYAVEYAGEQADDLKADAGTAVPFLPVNAFNQFTQQGDLYYALIGGRANLFTFELDVLQIDTEAEQADNNLVRAGFRSSGVSKQDRVLNRFASGVAAGQSYWISFDFDGGNGNGVNDVANESIFADPIDFTFAGGEAIFSLPNGLQAYYVADAEGNRLAEAPIGVVVDPAQNNGLVVNGASCHSCHNAGIIPFSDDVRPYVEANRIRFDQETYESVIEQYPNDGTYLRVAQADSEMHVGALERAGVPRKVPDAISRVFLDFQLGDIDARQAAGELGITQEELVENLNDLNPELAPLKNEGGHVDRNVFTEQYLDSLCRLAISSENQPVNCP
jgi:serine/threonine-protein kinase